LDSKSGEDAFVNLILNAKTKEYLIVARYTDETESVLKINIKAALADVNKE
jgi:hypothetical protein